MSLRRSARTTCSTSFRLAEGLSTKGYLRVQTQRFVLAPVGGLRKLRDSLCSLLDFERSLPAYLAINVAAGVNACEFRP
jgi:hypothetical protein